MDAIFNDALRNRTEKIIEYLRFNDVNIVDEKGQSLLHYACLGAANEVANILIDHGIDVNIMNNELETPIFLSVRNKLFGITKLLHQKGAKLYTINNRGESLLSVAVLNGSLPIIDYLLENYDYDFTEMNLNHENILFYALKGRKENLFIKFSQDNPDLVLCKDYHNTNLLQLAIKYNMSEIMLYLLDKISIYERDNEKNNAIMYLAKYGNSYLTNLILKRHPIIESKNIFGETVYQLSEHNSYDTHHLFESYKSSYDYVSYLRTYPFHVAVINGDYDILNYYNYDIKKEDVYGYSILDYAKIVNDENILQILKEKNQ